MPETSNKRPRTEKQIAATAKLVASNKAKRDAKKALLDNTPVEENVNLAIEKVAEESPESESDSEPDSEPEIQPDKPKPADFAGEAHYVAKDVRERVEKPIRRSRSVSSFRYGNKNLID